MQNHELATFVATSPVARRVRLDARIVLRRFVQTAEQLEQCIVRGVVPVDAEPVCELVVGGRVLARGEIVHENGRRIFRVTEVTE